MSKKQPLSYFEKRRQEIGLTDELNSIRLFDPEAEHPMPEYFDESIMREDIHGNIFIPLYTIYGKAMKYVKYGTGKTSSLNAKEKALGITRLKNHIIHDDGGIQKYAFPSKKDSEGFKVLPWVAPNLVEAMKSKTPVKTIVITEGYIKAIAGYVAGLHIFGLSSITHYRDKETMQLHSDIIDAIRELKVENVIVLYDGDCRNISTKALEKGDDLYKRPAGFFNSIRNIKELLKDTIKEQTFDVYFAHVDSSSVEGSPKGLDDMLAALPDKRTDILNDLTSFSKKNFYFYKKNITYNLGDLSKYLSIDSVQSFYTYHSELIKEKEFVYIGTKYKYDLEKKEVKIILPGAAKFYFRVGTTYYKKIRKPNKYKQLEEMFVEWTKATLEDDHGKGFHKHVDKYESFCNVPDHSNYQDVIHNCFNTYHPFKHQPEEGECPTSMMFMKHIFGEQLELGLDYMQLLYHSPTQALPILCLVSKENATGKSYFSKWLKAIYMQNMSIVGNEDLAGSFNAHYITKLIVCCDESYIDKKMVVEKVKSLSTADHAYMNAKGKGQVEMDIFCKFILLSNNEDNFIHATDEDIRYWVRKIPVVKEPREILPDLISEIPAFLHLLSKRQMHTPNVGSRMWFTAKDIMTDALQKLIRFNKPAVEKEITQKIRNIFFDFGIEELRMTCKMIRKEFFNNKYEENYIERVLKERFKVTTYKDESGKSKTIRYEFPKWVWNENTKENDYVLMKDVGRPFIFKRADFLTEQEMSEHELDSDIKATIQNVGMPVAPVAALPTVTLAPKQEEMEF